MYLYRFLKNYDQNQFQAILATEKKSPLFASLQPKIIYRSMEEHSPRLNWRKITTRIGDKLHHRNKQTSFGIFLEMIHNQFQPDEWVLNTILMHKALPAASNTNAKVTSIIHEMPSAYSFISEAGMEALITQSQRIICNSNMTCKAISTMGRPDVILQPGFFDPNEILLSQPRPELRAKLGIKKDDFVLIGSGSLDHNKGIELFLEISKLALASNERLKFLWIGAERHSGFNYYLNSYRKSLSESSNLIFTNEITSDYYAYLNIADAFLLTSFNESFSLVTLEAMALGKPVLTYDCGGIRDFVNTSSGRILTTREPKAWLESISWLQNNSDRFSKTELKLLAQKYSTDNQVPNLTAILAGHPLG